MIMGTTTGRSEGGIMQWWCNVVVIVMENAREGRWNRWKNMIIWIYVSELMLRRRWKRRRRIEADGHVVNVTGIRSDNENESEAVAHSAASDPFLH